MVLKLSLKKEHLVCLRNFGTAYFKLSFRDNSEQKKGYVVLNDKEMEFKSFSETLIKEDLQRRFLEFSEREYKVTYKQKPHLNQTLVFIDFEQRDSDAFYTYINPLVYSYQTKDHFDIK